MLSRQTTMAGMIASAYSVGEMQTLNNFLFTIDGVSLFSSQQIHHNVGTEHGMESHRMEEDIFTSSGRQLCAEKYQEKACCFLYDNILLQVLHEFPQRLSLCI